MSIAPPISVPTPAFVPAPYGLFSVATLIDTSDGHLIAGVEFPPTLACVNPGVVTGDLCASGPVAKEVGQGGWSIGVPAVVTSAYTCSGPVSPAQVQAGAMTALANNEERAVSDALIIGDYLASGSDPLLSNFSRHHSRPRPELRPGAGLP